MGCCIGFSVELATEPFFSADFSHSSPKSEPLVLTLPYSSAYVQQYQVCRTRRFAPREAYAARYARSGRKSTRSGQKVDD